MGDGELERGLLLGLAQGATLPCCSESQSQPVSKPCATLHPRQPELISSLRFGGMQCKRLTEIELENFPSSLPFVNPSKNKIVMKHVWQHWPFLLMSC
jgi:hypothetical protein